MPKIGIGGSSKQHEVHYDVHLYGNRFILKCSGFEVVLVHGFDCFFIKANRSLVALLALVAVACRCDDTHVIDTSVGLDLEPNCDVCRDPGFACFFSELGFDRIDKFWNDEALWEGKPIADVVNAILIGIGACIRLFLRGWGRGRCLSLSSKCRDCFN